MIYCLIADNKLIHINTSAAKINDKIICCKISNPKSKIMVKTFSDMDFKHTFEGKREVLRKYIEKCLIVKK